MAQAAMEPGGTTAVRYGGFWRRVAAALIDAVIIGVALYILSLFLPVIEEAGLGSISPSSGDFGITAEASLTPLGTLILIIGGWLYEALMESGRKQATVGKMALSLQVTDLDGDRIGFAQASGRYFAKILSLIILLIGFLMVAFTGRKQGLHDILARTLVIRRP
jgi:uncharacterized RDD family membrane protein YckC